MEESCCYCKHRESKQELTQDRLDVDIVHFCLKKDDWISTDYGKVGCEYFNLLDELKKGE